MIDLRVRNARPEDLEGIVAIVTQAFGQPDEAILVQQLIADGDDTLSLVAANAHGLLGHVMASPIVLEPPRPLRCLGIAPLSVHPRWQRHGVGGRLMHAVIEASRTLGADALFLLGNPAYYARFGFTTSSIGNDYGASDAFQMLELTTGSLQRISGSAHYAAAFGALDATG